MAKQMFVYIMTNKGNRVLYIGVTNDLSRRAYEHKHKVNNSFPARYNVNKLVYFEVFEDPLEAIARRVLFSRRSLPAFFDLVGQTGNLTMSLRGTRKSHSR